MGAYFDVVEFLGLADLTEERKKVVRPMVLKDLTLFILARFTDQLSEEQLKKVERLMAGLRGYEEVMAVIYRMDPDFEKKKLEWLEEYKRGFDLTRLEKRTKTA